MAGIFKEIFPLMNNFIKIEDIDMAVILQTYLFLRMWVQPCSLIIIWS